MVLIYKTSVRYKKQVKAIEPSLDALLAPQGDWNFDLQDCDRILRVETPDAQVPARVVELLDRHGFECLELQD
jgi:hypothetical protein